MYLKMIDFSKIRNRKVTSEKLKLIQDFHVLKDMKTLLTG